MFKFWDNLATWKKITIIVVFVLIIAAIFGIILYIILHKKDHKESFTETDKYTGDNVIWSFCEAWRNSILDAVGVKK